MFGLFSNTYDYYEWHDLIVVSNSVEKLIDYALEHKMNILDGVEQENACKNEQRHFVIEKVEFI
jgi:hypothetical protein